MNNPVRVILLLVICSLLIACGQAVTASPTPSTTVVPTLTPSPSQISTETPEPTPRPTYVRPTLIPTIDSMLVHDLLKNAFSIQMFSDVNGHDIRKITGWENGFGTSAAWYVYCPSYVWLDSNHILLYPITGQITHPIEMEMRTVAVVPQPVVINLTSGTTWLPPVNTLSGALCNPVDWSRDLNILITTQIQNEMPTVSTYTYEGNKLTTYPGEIIDVSPKGTKLLMKDGTVLDLQANNKIKLNWNLEDYHAPPPPSEVYWTSDETRIYQCCYLFADLAKGTSFRFTESDFLDGQGNPIDYGGLWMYRGEWVRDDTFFLVWWSWLDDGNIRYLPMIDPSSRTFYDVREMAGIPKDWTSWNTFTSLDQSYLWMTGWDGSYLVNLYTFEVQYYPEYSYANVEWSSDSKFALIEMSDPTNQSLDFEVLSVSDNKVSPLPILPPSEYYTFWWHPIESVLIYPAKDKNALIFLDLTTMSFRELLFKDQNTSYQIRDLSWSPSGEKLAFVTDNNALWLVDYPALENLEHILSALSVLSVTSVKWSPDGKTVAFIGNSDIYIVEPNNTTP